MDAIPNSCGDFARAEGTIYTYCLYEHVSLYYTPMKNNPFRNRIGKVFCSSETGFMGFDDFLEMVSALHHKVHTLSDPTHFILFLLINILFSLTILGTCLCEATLGFPSLW